MGLRFYLATSLKRAEEASYLANLLKEVGWVQTFDWTQAVDLQLSTSQEPASDSYRAEVCLQELEGVLSADVVVVLLPGGRGTHTELGAALAANKPVILVFKSLDDLNTDGHPMAFYRHPNIGWLWLAPSQLEAAQQVRDLNPGSYCKPVIVTDSYEGVRASLLYAFERTKGEPHVEPQPV